MNFIEKSKFILGILDGVWGLLLIQTFLKNWDAPPRFSKFPNWNWDFIFFYFDPAPPLGNFPQIFRFFSDVSFLALMFEVWAPCIIYSFLGTIDSTLKLYQDYLEILIANLLDSTWPNENEFQGKGSHHNQKTKIFRNISK